MNDISRYAWEDWQLTAYLLNELESDDAAKIKAAAEADTQLAEKLTELSETIGMVKSAFATEPLSTSDQAILARLQSSTPHLNNAVAGAELARGPMVTRQSLIPRLASRWENWASLAGLILIGVLLVDRQYNGQSIALLGGARQTIDIGAPADMGRPADSDEVAVLELNNSREAVALAKQADASMGMGGASPFASRTEAESLGDGVAPTTPMPNFSDAADYSPQASVLASGAESSAPLDLAYPASQPGASASPTLASNGALASNGGMAGGMGGMGGSMGGMSNRARGAMPGSPMSDRPVPAMIGGSAEGFGEGGGFGLIPESRRRGMHSEFQRPDGSMGGDRFEQITDNSFKPVSQDPLSTFSIDVDTASYSKSRQYLMEYNQAPPPAAVRLEEFINSFDYKYTGPEDDKPFAAALAISDCPWTPEHKLVRIALQAKQVDIRERPKANLVFLLDVSGSMNEPNKLPLVKESIRLLTYQLQENDRVAMVVYAGAAGCVLSSTPGNRQDQILAAIDRLNAGGSTNGGQGIQLAYSMARDQFIPGGINRVILCTDGDFNVGLTGNQELVNLVKQEAAGNIFLTVLGYGMGNTNDAMMEQIADKGNGVYGFVDSHREAQKQMVKQLAGNLMTVAKDVKIQVEFNPAKIREYRLLGYENRVMAHEDFNNDKKDAGEIGAGHRVTALYEVAMVGSPEPKAPVDNLRYQTAAKQEDVKPATSLPVSEDKGQVSQELLAVKLRYKQPEANESQLLVFPLEDKQVPLSEADADFRWSAAMAEFGMLLRNSPHRGQASWPQLFDRARQAVGSPADPTRVEALEMIRKASQLVPR